MVGHGGSSAGWYLADPTSPIPSHCALIVVTSTLRVNKKMRAHYDELIERTFVVLETQVASQEQLYVPIHKDYRR